MELIKLAGSFVQPQDILAVSPLQESVKIGPKGFGHVYCIDVKLVGYQKIKLRFDDEASRDERLTQIIEEVRIAK